MHKPIRNLIAGGVLAATLIGGGATAAQAATSAASSTTTASASSTSATSTAAPTKADHEARRAERAAALAEQLGVTVDQVTTAEDAARAAVDAEYGRPEKPTTDPGTAPSGQPPELTDAQKAELEARHDLFESTFAAKLGVSVADLETAQLAVEQAHLADEVAAGHLTQAQADERLQAIEDGTAPLGGPGGPGGPGRGGPPPAKAEAA